MLDNGVVGLFQPMVYSGARNLIRTSWILEGMSGGDAENMKKLLD